MIYLSFSRFCCNLLVVVCTALLSSPTFAADLKDLLDPDRLAKHIRADKAQKTTLAFHVQKLRQAIADYQWERGKQTCEAWVWQAHHPDIRKLRELRKNARKGIDAILDSLKAGLDPKQLERIDKLLKGKGNILDAPISDIPFYHINNTPLFPDFQTRTRAYRLTLPGSPSVGDAWAYADYLRTWTVRGFIPTQRPIDALGQEQVGGIQRPDIQVRQIPGSSFGTRVVRSPLLLAATLMVPDLGRAEAELLWDHYSRESEDREAAFDHYWGQNRLNDAILIRLKLSTPFAEAYLNLDRWIIYLEDSEGIGYEPAQVDQGAFYPLEALEITLPGREAEVTDVFGTYTGMPGYKEHIYLEAPSKIVYTGHEKLLKLFFPSKGFQDRPVVTEKTQFLKLVVQSQENDLGRAELVWDLKRSKSGPPKKDKK